MARVGWAATMLAFGTQQQFVATDQLVVDNSKDGFTLAEGLTILGLDVGFKKSGLGIPLHETERVRVQLISANWADLAALEEIQASIKGTKDQTVNVGARLTAWERLLFVLTPNREYRTWNVDPRRGLVVRFHPRAAVHLRTDLGPNFVSIRTLPQPAKQAVLVKATLYGMY